MAYNRIYRLVITPVNLDGSVKGKSIVVTSPITTRFNIQRMPFAGACQATFDVYNLNQDTREKLFLDYYDFENIREIRMEAGYENGKFDLIYRGRIMLSKPQKSRTDVFMHIESISGLSALDSMLHVTVKEGETLQSVSGRIINYIPGVQQGEISLPDYTFQRPVALIGNGLAVLKKYTKDNVFIDLDQIVVIDKDEVIQGDVRIISDETGLLGVPERQRTSITVNCVFEPRIKVGQGLEIKSRIAPQFDGQYKVWGVSHSGVIGGTQGGECITTIQLWTGLNLFGRYKSSWEEVKKRNPNVSGGVVE